MATIIFFRTSEAEGGGLAGITVTESPEQVDNQWQAQNDHHNLMHLTQRSNERTIRVNCEAVAFWGERQS